MTPAVVTVLLETNAWGKSRAKTRANPVSMSIEDVKRTCVVRDKLVYKEMGRESPQPRSGDSRTSWQGKEKEQKKPLPHKKKNSGYGHITHWRVFLRRQVKKTAPDIRIAMGEKSIAVIEIKAKGGWIQPFLSKERYNADKVKLENRSSSYNPDETIRRLKAQISKYRKEFSLKADDIYYLLPTLTNVHRNKFPSLIKDYYNYFSKTSGLPKSNLILLSRNLILDLSRATKNADLDPTDDFERMITSLRSKCPIQVKGTTSSGNSDDKGAECEK